MEIQDGKFSIWISNLNVIDSLCLICQVKKIVYKLRIIYNITQDPYKLHVSIELRKTVRVCVFYCGYIFDEFLYYTYIYIIYIITRASGMFAEIERGFFRLMSFLFI